MSHILAVMGHALKEEMRRKTLYLFFLFPPICILTSSVFTSQTPGSEKAFIIDIALSSISFILMLMTAFFTYDLFAKESNQGTAYFYLINPIQSYSVIFGRHLGCFFILILESVVMSIFTLLLLYFKFESWGYNFVKAIFLMWGQFSILLGFGILGAVFLSKFTNILFVMVVYMAGHLSDIRHYFKEHFSVMIPANILSIILKIFPDFKQFEARDAIVLNIDISWSTLAQAYSYALVFTACLLVLSSLMVRKRLIK